MNHEELRNLLREVAAGRLDPEHAADLLANGPMRMDELSFATLDHHRVLRQGLAEVVYGQGKEIPDLIEIVDRLAGPGVPVLATRLDPEGLEALIDRFPHARGNERAGTCLVNPPDEKGPEDGEPFAAIVSGGTADLPVAEEAAEVCVAMEVALLRVYDVGVAGLHRLLRHLRPLREASAVVVVAGMEGALPSVVGGLLSCPVFAVPTSVGYGASFQGLAALLAMLNSCAPGVTVSNIDNGFSAGIAAARVVKALNATTPQEALATERSPDRMATPPSKSA